MGRPPGPRRNISTGQPTAGEAKSKGDFSMKNTNRRKFIGGGVAVAAAAVAVPAKAQDKAVKRVIYRNGQKPAKPPLFSGTVAFGNLLFIAGIGAHFEGDIKAHTKHVLDQIQQQLEAAGSSMEKVLK